KKFTKKNYDATTANSSFSAEAEQTFRDLQESQRSNVIIYAHFSPFVGCGTNIGGWSFTVDLNRGKQDIAGARLSPKSFSAADLYEQIGDTLRKQELPNCSVEDKVCISGLDIRDERFLPNILQRPRTRVEDSVLQEYVAQPTTQARHYQMFRLV